jgi:hypothetical protein
VRVILFSNFHLNYLRDGSLFCFIDYGSSLVLAIFGVFTIKCFKLIEHYSHESKVIPLTEPILTQRYLIPTCVIDLFFASIFLTLLLNGGDTLALQYVNYTSYKYKIQFQYPTDWVQSEKLSSHDKGADISVSKLSKENGTSNGSLFWIVLGNDTAIGSDLQAGLQHVMKILNDSNALNKYEIIQPPSFTTIDGQMAGTFISYSRHRFGDAELETVEQFWLTYVRSVDYYLMSFIAPIQSFSNSDNVMIRNQLVNSIKVLDATDMAKSEFP